MVFTLGTIPNAHSLSLALSEDLVSEQDDFERRLNLKFELINP
jgi:hypothetical protein